MKKLNILLKSAALTGLVGLLAQTHASGAITHVSTDWLGSSNNGGSAQFDISVESSYSGYKGVYDDGGGAPGAESSGSFGVVDAYRFWASSNTAISTLAQGGTNISDITTTDTAFQNASFLHLWETTASNGNNFDTTSDYNSGVTFINNLNEGATGSINISEYRSGTIYFIYGSYRSTPSFSVSSTNDLGNIHNGDFANNNEFYIAQVDFVREGGETIDWELGSGFNGRFSGIVIADVVPVPEPSSTALLGLGGLAFILRRRR